MKNKKSRSAAKRIYLLSTKISAKEEIYTSTCVARKSAANVMANKTTGRITNSFSIEQRPTIVAENSRIGDWEGDTIIVKGNQGVCHYSYRA
jgi:transposase, IS30 family